MDDTFAREFNKKAARIAEETRRAFPNRLNRLLVVVLGTDTPIYVGPEIAAPLTKEAGAVRETIERLAKKLRGSTAGGAVKGYKLAGTTVDVIALKDINEIALPTTDPRDKEMEATFFLDHELGHHILRNGSRTIVGVSEHLAESAADAFAMLRHIQRFGKDTGQVRDLPAALAWSIIFSGEMGHYTANTIERAIEKADEMGKDFFRLSLQETAELAAQIADETHLEDSALERIRDAYSAVAQADKSLRYAKIFSIMEQHLDDPDIFDAGKRVLNYPAVKTAIKNVAVTGSASLREDKSWQRLLAYMNGAKVSENKPAKKEPQRPVFGLKR